MDTVHPSRTTSNIRHHNITYFKFLKDNLNRTTNEHRQEHTHTHTNKDVQTISRKYHMLLPIDITCCFKEIHTPALQLPYEAVHASTLINKLAHEVQRRIPKQPMQKPIEPIPWQECSMQISSNPQHKHAQGNLPYAKTHAIQIPSKRYQYPPNQSDLG